MKDLLENCLLCPRECGVNRIKGQKGFCMGGENAFVAKTMVHKWEEPCISGENGTGAVFFAGCNMHCSFCQNKDISFNTVGKEYDAEKLCDLLLSLCEKNVHTIDLVTPTHFAVTVAKALERVRKDIHIPIVYNTSGYEKKETLELFEGLVDVYLPDFKYYSDSIALKYSNAPFYRDFAEKALEEMYRQTGKYEEDGNGIVKKGVIIRHLVLPSHRKDSIKVLETIAKLFPVRDIRLSLMSQFTPDFADKSTPELQRRITTFEYESVLKRAEELGFFGFCQEKSSSDKKYTPDWE